MAEIGVRITGWDGNVAGIGQEYQMMLEAGADYQQSGDVDETRRGDGTMLAEAFFLNPKGFDILVWPLAGGAVDPLVFARTVRQWFDPGRNSDGVRYLTANVDEIAVRLGCLVPTWERVPKRQNHYRVSLRAPDVYYEAAALTTATTSPIVNAGTKAAYPVVSLTTTTHASHKRCTVTGQGADGGVEGYPIRLNINDAALAATNVFAFIGGDSVPLTVVNPGTATSAVWLLADTHSDGVTSTIVDVIYGAGLSNPKAGTFDAGGMHLVDSTNAAWQYDNFQITSHERHAGVFQPDQIGILSGGGGDAGPQWDSFGISAESAGSISFNVGALGAEDANAMVATIPAGVGTSSDMVNWKRVTSGMVSGRAFIRYQTPGRAGWIDAWTTQSAGTDTTSLDIDTAVVVAIGVEFSFSGSDTAATLIVSSNGSTSGTRSRFDLNLPPTVVVGAAANVDVYNGVFQIGAGPALTFANTFASDGTLSIDAARGVVETLVASGILFNPPIANQSRLLSVPTGSNVVTNSAATGATPYSVAYRERWA